MQDAITDESLTALANLENTTLDYLDISYNKDVTDEGLKAFEGKTFPLHTLKMNALSGVTGAGLYFPIFAGKATLKSLHVSLYCQEEVKVAEWGKAVGHCFKLEILNLAGNKHLTDEFFNNLFGVEVEIERTKTKPGLAHLQTIKLNFCELISDMTVSRFL